MFNFLRFFKKKKDTKINTDLKEIKNNLPKDINYDMMDPIIEAGVDSNNIILLMDDFIEQFTLYELDFKRIKRKYGFDITKEFKIYEARGMYAGFTTNKLIDDIDNLSLAVLDMTLETSIKLENGTIVEYDGVDIALKILNKFKKCEIVFCTAHSLNRRDPLMRTYIEKFENATGKDFSNYYMSKADNRSDILYEKIKLLTKK